MSRNTFFTLAAALVFAGSARAQLIWQSYNTSGSRVSSDAATYDSGTSSYSFSIPAGAIHTFVTTNFVPVSFSAGQTKTVTFTMTATGGFGPSGTPVQNKRFIAYGLFDYGATPPGAMGNFTDDKGLWTDSYQQASGIAAEVFGGTSTTANLLSYASATQLGAAIGPSSGAVGQFTDNSATDVTFRIVMNGAGTSSSIGTGTATNVAGAWYTDQATGGTAFNRTIYSAGTAAVAGALNFNEFAFMFSNSTGGSVTLTLANIGGVTPPPIITSQPPPNSSTTVGSDLTLTVGASGATSYQWQKSTDGGASFNPVSGNATATTASLTLSNIALGDAGIYNVVVTNAAGSTTSDNAAVTVSTGTTPPSIGTQPLSATVLVGDAASFTVTASGTSPLSYQWQKSSDGGTTFPDNVGTDSATFSLGSVSLADAGHYRVVVTNGAGSATSSAASLTVNEPPLITVQPVGTMLAAGAGHTLSVTASGSPAPTYQWKLNGVNLGGATSSSYDLTNASGADAGLYSCVATNAAGSATSDSVYVGVLSTMAVNALAPANGSVGRNRDVLFKMTFDQPVSVGTTGRVRIYDASAPTTPVETIDLAAGVSVTQFGTSYRYLLKDISGRSFAYLPILVDGNSVTICPHSSTALDYGKTYFVNIEPGVLLDAGGATFGGISDSSTWAFSTKASGPAASAPTIQVAADGSGDFDTVQGAVDFIPFSPANTIPRRIEIQDGIYTEIVRLRSGQNLVTMQGQSRAGTTIQYLSNNNTAGQLPALGASFSSVGQRSVFGSEPNDFTLQRITLRNSTPFGGSQAECFWVGNNAARMTVSEANLLSYQDTFMSNGGVCYLTNCYVEGSVDFVWGSGKTFFNNCELKMVGQVSGGIYVQARNTPATTPGYFFYQCQLTQGPGVAAGGSYLARIDPNASGGYPASQVVWMNCLMDAHIHPSGWQLNNATTAPEVKFWEHQSVELDGTTPVVISSRPTYNHIATGVGGSTVLDNQQIDAASAAFYSDANHAIGWWPLPEIAGQPAAQTKNPGESVTFSVIATATATLPLSYQWYKDGVAIAGATAASYQIPSITSADWGSYSVAVTNGAGAVSSSGAQLTVNDPLALWADSYGLNPATTGAGGADPDGDHWSNLAEFAFGMDPTDGNLSAVAVSGSSLLNTGMPLVVLQGPPPAVTYAAHFVRRQTHAAEGLVYTPQFSADLVGWEDSTATLTVIASDATHEVVRVPFPLLIGGKPARFFRVALSAGP
ncbi:MAG: immunoglobulin domain-containing protein [Verrucomicrobiales bacterium]|nr:immunoglobulin domain-containing protein [Verrucomicrobiales bacterium]